MENLPDIKNQLSSKELFEAFKTQLLKDFKQSSYSSDFIEGLEPSYTKILETIATVLQRENNTPTNLMQLLNRIDISEAQLKRYLHKNKDENYFHVVAELIIKRVLQKVVIKRYYKSNENSC
jgi:hypothetical protein